MNRKKTITPSEWTMQAIKESKDCFIDVHFDVFKDYKNQNGLSLLKYACLVLTEVRSVTNSEINQKKGFKAFVYIPFSYDRRIRYWKDSNWMKLGEKNKEITYEPPLCIISKENFLSNNFNIEEYHCPIDFPSDFSNDGLSKISALLCCFRDQQAIKNSWEFDTRIYLYCAEDF